MEKSEPYRGVLCSATVLEVTGADSSRYLQSQMTQDISGIGDGESVYSLWLNDRGKIEGDCYVLRRGDAFVLASLQTPPDTLWRLVERHIIADEVEVAWWAKKAIASAVSREGEKKGALVIREPRGGTPLWLAMEPEERSRDKIENGRWTRERILRRIAAVPSDVGPRDTPFDLGLVEVAMSFNKGCYLGQEVMAKLHSRGRDKLDLFRLRGQIGPGEAHAAVRTIRIGGGEAGRLLCEWSEAGEWLGLAQLKRQAVEAEKDILVDGIAAVTIF